MWEFGDEGLVVHYLFLFEGEDFIDFFLYFLEVEVFLDCLFDNEDDIVEIVWGVMLKF
jgi:hypothetical protein